MCYSVTVSVVVFRLVCCFVIFCVHIVTCFVFFYICVSVPAYFLVYLFVCIDAATSLLLTAPGSVSFSCSLFCDQNISVVLAIVVTSSLMLSILVCCSIAITCVRSLCYLLLFDLYNF